MKINNELIQKKIDVLQNQLKNSQTEFDKVSRNIHYNKSLLPRLKGLEKGIKELKKEIDSLLELNKTQRINKPKTPYKFKKKYTSISELHYARYIATKKEIWDVVKSLTKQIKQHEQQKSRTTQKK